MKQLYIDLHCFKEMNIRKQLSNCLQEPAACAIYDYSKYKIVAYGVNRVAKVLQPCKLKCNIISGKNKLCNAIHPEIMALTTIYKSGIDPKTCGLYVLKLPCVECTKIIAIAGIKEVVYNTSIDVSEFHKSMIEKLNFRHFK